MEFTFSYRQEIYDEKREPLRQYLKWTNKEETWSYDKCMIDVIGMEQNKARIVVRRKFSKPSKFMEREFDVNVMMGFVVTGVKNNHTSLEFTIQQSQDKNYDIRDKHRELNDVKISGEKNNISKLYQKIKDNMGNPPKDTHIFSSKVITNTEFLPVIYQPKIDAWHNFLREINVHKNSKKYEITLVFEGEKLRKHAIFDFLYKKIRLAIYHRTKDIETFYVDSEYFEFPGIYSGDATLFDDTIHNDKESVEKRKIKYHYQDKNHPIVFINTSNHAMASHDNNHDFWKLEYIPWGENLSFKVEKKTKQETEEQYRRK